MRIITRSTKSNPKRVLFIFEFIDGNDYENWCLSLFNQAQYSFNHAVQKSIESIVDTLVARIGNKYENKEYAISGYLFEDEACELIMDLMVTSDQFYNEWFAGEFGNPEGNCQKKNKENLNKEDDLDIDMDL